MESNNPSNTITPDHDHALHTPLLNLQPRVVESSHRTPSKVIIVTFGSIVFLMSLVALIINQSGHNISNNMQELPSGVAQGVSTKSNPSSNFHQVSYNWTNAMFSWQRTAFHFQPQKNWMNGKFTLHSFLFLIFFLFHMFLHLLM